ncbi:MAG: TIGR04197 family type VII secretion effector [Mogibacterium sp.]|nr:TIGR04197 family type VII secretion effector [Mogibacterium sp.]
MGNRVIKIDASAVSVHTMRLNTKNSNLRSKASNSFLFGGKTNFTGYTKGIACRKDFGDVIITLVKKIEQDCKNVNYAAAELNGMDAEISKKLDGKGLFLNI